MDTMQLVVPFLLSGYHASSHEQYVHAVTSVTQPYWNSVTEFGPEEETATLHATTLLCVQISRQHRCGSENLYAKTDVNKPGLERPMVAAKLGREHHSGLGLERN
jgi:hypothetical protein